MMDGLSCLPSPTGPFQSCTAPRLLEPLAQAYFPSYLFPILLLINLSQFVSKKDVCITSASFLENLGRAK